MWDEFYELNRDDIQNRVIRVLAKYGEAADYDVVRGLLARVRNPFNHLMRESKDEGHLQQQVVFEAVLREVMEQHYGHGKAAGEEQRSAGWDDGWGARAGAR